jgi:hypothetical protein
MMGDIEVPNCVKEVSNEKLAEQLRVFIVPKLEGFKVTQSLVIEAANRLEKVKS